MRYLWCLVAVLTLGVVAVNYYVVNEALSEFEIANKQTFQMQESMRFAAISQEVVRIEARRNLKLELALEQATQIFQALTEEKAQLTKVLEETASTSADLINENAELQKGLDEMSIRYVEKIDMIDLLEQQLTDVTRKLDELTKKVVDTLVETRKDNL